MSKEQWSNAWYLLTLRPAAVAFLGWWLGGAWSLVLFAFCVATTHLVGRWMGYSEVTPLIAPVKKYSARWFCYESLMPLCVMLAFAWLLTLLFCVNLQALSWIERAGVFVTTVWMFSYANDFGHEMIHKKAWVGHAVHRIFSGFLYETADHVPVHHHPKKNLTDEDRSWPTGRTPFVHFFKIIFQHLLCVKELSFFLLYAALLTGVVGVVKTLFVLAASWTALYFIILQAEADHYGFMKRKRANGTYEPYAPWMTWDTTHVLTNFLFFNAQRHAHHHECGSLPWTSMKIWPGSSRFPYGYWTMFWMANVRPKKFEAVMRALVDKAYADHPLENGL